MARVVIHKIAPFVPAKPLTDGSTHLWGIKILIFLSTQGFVFPKRL